MVPGVTVFPSISVRSFCCKAGVPAGVFRSLLSLPYLQSLHGISAVNLEYLLPLESQQEAFSAVTFFLAISAWSFCCKAGVPVVTGVPTGVVPLTSACSTCQREKV